jgi:hypothetical protein
MRLFTGRVIQSLSSSIQLTRPKLSYFKGNKKVTLATKSKIWGFKEISLKKIKSKTTFLRRNIKKEIFMNYLMKRIKINYLYRNVKLVETIFLQ